MLNTILIIALCVIIVALAIVSYKLSQLNRDMNVISDSNSVIATACLDLSFMLLEERGEIPVYKSSSGERIAIGTVLKIETDEGEYEGILSPNFIPGDEDGAVNAKKPRCVMFVDKTTGNQTEIDKSKIKQISIVSQPPFCGITLK